MSAGDNTSRTLVDNQSPGWPDETHGQGPRQAKRGPSLLDSLAARPYLIGMVLLRERTRPGLGLIAIASEGPAFQSRVASKHDGFRILPRGDSAGVGLITRAGNDFAI